MTQPKTQRLRDPVHGLIVFRADNPVDRLAWRLLDTAEFQRLRRIRQLGVSEFVFPSATHTRFAHCIGVFHTARELVRIIKRELKSTGQPPYNSKRAEVAVIAALLHDLGHGPFSHTFEDVQKSRGVKKRHEKWTEEIVRNPAGGIRPLLERHWPTGGFCDQVADLLGAEDPSDIYHAIVSSSFDADRLDYLRRDRLMTGTGAGAIDFDWLMEHIRVREIEIEAADAAEDEHQAKVPTFCLDPKALPAAEQFLLARYTLHEQVYFHKTTRCVQKMIERLLRRVATLAQDYETADSTGLEKDHPLRRFFSEDEIDLKADRSGSKQEQDVRNRQILANYLALDDLVVMGAIQRMCRASDSLIKDLASRLRERRLYKPLDLGAFGYDEGVQRRQARRIDRDFTEKLENGSVIKDEEAVMSIYTHIGGDDDRAHKRLHILDKATGPVEITSVSEVIKALRVPKKFTRYYFQNGADRDRAWGQRRETA